MLRITFIIILAFAFGCQQTVNKEEKEFAKLDQNNGIHGFFIGDSINHNLLNKFDGEKCFLEKNNCYELAKLESLKVYGITPDLFSVVYSHDILKEIRISFMPEHRNIDTLMHYTFKDYGRNFTRFGPNKYTASMMYIWQTKNNKLILHPGIDEYLALNFSSPFVDSILYCKYDY